MNIIFLFSLFFHPVHVSVTNIEYQESENLFEVSFKLFYDDFENIIFSKYNVQMNLGTEEKQEDEDIFFLRYINENFQIIMDGEVLKPEYRSRKLNEDSIWLSFIFRTSKPAKKIEIKNRLLMDLFMDQSNLVIFNSSGLEKGYILKRKNDKIDIHLSNE